MRNRAEVSTPVEAAELVTRVEAALLDPTPAVRMEGVEALVQLADTSPVHRLACVRVLCAALRAPFDPQDHSPGEPHLRRLMLDAIRDHLLNPAAASSWSGFPLDLSGATLDGGDLSGIRLSGGSLRLTRARLTGSLDLSGSTVEHGAELLFDRAWIGGQVLLDGLTLLDGQVVFDRMLLDGGDVSIEDATLSGGHLLVVEAQLASGRVSLAGSRVDGTSVTFHGSTLSGADLLMDRATITAGRCYLTSMMVTGGTISFRDAKLARPLLSLRMSTLAGGTLDLGGVQPQQTLEPDGGPDSFEGVYLIPPVSVDWGPWPEAAEAILDLRDPAQDDEGAPTRFSRR